MAGLHLQYGTIPNAALLWSSRAAGSRGGRLIAAVPLSDLCVALRHLGSLCAEWDAGWQVSSRDAPACSSGILSIAEDDSNVQYAPCHGASSLDDESLALVREIHNCISQLRQRGISLRTIREALLQFQKPSRLLVTPDFRILLPDFNNLEIPLTPLPKALYLLYLRHPEGVAFKSLSDHRDELLRLYTLLAPTLNPQRREQHVRNLTDPTCNSLNEKVSQIQRAFSRYLDTSLLPFYTITGEKGTPHIIRLPRHLVTFNPNP